VDNAIYIGLGGNLPHPRYGSPKATLEAALASLRSRGIEVRRVSPWYRTAPLPASDQPWYINAVAEISANLPADRLLAELHAVEEDFGRVRSVPNAPGSSTWICWIFAGKSPREGRARRPCRTPG